MIAVLLIDSLRFISERDRTVGRGFFKDSARTFGKKSSDLIGLGLSSQNPRCHHIHFFFSKQYKQKMIIKLVISKNTQRKTLLNIISFLPILGGLMRGPGLKNQAEVDWLP